MKLSYTTRQLCLLPQSLTVVTARLLRISQGTLALKTKGTDFKAAVRPPVDSILH